MSETEETQKQKKMSDYQRRNALKVIDSLLEFRIADIFAVPVDPRRDGCPDYFKVITRPMDLGTVRSKLVNNEYESTIHFKADVRRIWDNTYKYHGVNSLISKFAKQLQQEFEGMTIFLTGDDLADWVSESEWLKSLLDIKIYGNKLIQFLNKDITLDDMLAKEELPNLKLLNKTEKRKLVKDLSKLKNEEHIAEIIRFIQNEDPTLVCNNEVDIELDELSDRSIALLKRKLGQLTR